MAVRTFAGQRPAAPPPIILHQSPLPHVLAVRASARGGCHQTLAVRRSISLSPCSRILGSPPRRSTELRDLDSSLSLRYSGARRSRAYIINIPRPRYITADAVCPHPGSATERHSEHHVRDRSVHEPSTSTRSICRRRISDAIRLHRCEHRTRTRPKTYTARRTPWPRTE